MTRADLSQGQKASQATHAAIDYQHAFPKLAVDWHRDSNTVVLLKAANESELYETRDQLLSSRIQFVEVYEPDLGHELTALAFVGSVQTRPDQLNDFDLVGRGSKQYRLGSAQRKVIDAMQETSQTDTQNVLQHGLAVRKRLFELVDHLKHETTLTGDWKIPDWVTDYKEQILDALPPQDILHQYTVYHDCGKPFCLEHDEEGRRHFPDHARVSYETYMRAWGNERVANIILRDMSLHTMKAADVPELATFHDVTALMLTSLAEIHANADMFGGIDSTSFKIKWKQINKRGKALCKNLWSDK